MQVVGVEPAERSVISGENPGEEPCWFIFLIWIHFLLQYACTA